MSATHTPGPWQVSRTDPNGQPIVASATDLELATCWHHCVGGMEREAHANARLIAAAPELLEALKAIVDDLLDGDDTGALQVAQHAGLAAISKATGNALRSLVDESRAQRSEGEGL